MDDERLIAAFESCELSGDEFSHTEHVRVAWWYLKQYPFEDARQRFSDALRRFAASKGKAERYHETITVAYLVLIAERLQQTPALAWPTFAEAHPDLLARTPPIVARYYTDETLKTERARGEFVRPDREQLPTCAGVGRHARTGSGPRRA